MTDIDDVLEEMPTLAAVPAFVQILQNTPWFRSLGDPASDKLRAEAEDYTSALGFPDAYPIFLTDWEDAASAAETQDFNSASWEAEEQARAVLTEALVNTMGEDTFELVMSHIQEKVSEVIGYGAEEAAENLHIEDEQFIAAAIGAGAQAAHQAALVMLTGVDSGEVDEEHPFTARFKMFEAGRWPIGILGSSFSVF